MNIKLLPLLLPFLLSGCIKSFDCREYYEEEVRPSLISGKVSKKFRDGNNRDMMTIEFVRGPRLILGGELGALFRNAEVGDSIYKDSETLIFSLKKYGSGEVFTYKPECK